MIKHPRSLEDGQIGRGSVNTVQRQGDVIVRPTGPWSPAIHDLLKHLARVGFPYAPRLVGVDLDGKKEYLTYIHGEVAMRPWPDYLRTCSGLEQIGTMLRKYHDCVSDFKPQSNSSWRDPEVVWVDGMIVRHGDLGPWNIVWESGRLMGLIDWDMAEPGYPLDDLAQAAWCCIPLRPKERCNDAGIDINDLQNRLDCLCGSYGIDSQKVIKHLFFLEKSEIDRTNRLAAQGVEPWVGFKDRGDIKEMTAELDWLHTMTQCAQQGDAPERFAPGDL